MEGMSSSMSAFIRKDHEEAVRLIRLRDPDAFRWDDPALLYHSISNGWLDVTRYLITNHYFTPHKLYAGQSCLYIAAKGNFVDIVEYLIKECGCDPMMDTIDPDAEPEAAVEYNCVPVLHYVASEGLLNILKCMVMNINGHIMDRQYCDNGRTVLHLASVNNHIDVVKYLINECNCDIMTPDKDGNTILHYAASKGSLDFLKSINTHHYNIMSANNKGRTVLHYAVKHIDVVKYLINECNCDVMVTDKDGWTPLHLAFEHIDVVKYLINDCSCDTMVTDKRGQTPLHLAADRGTPVSTGNCDPLAKDNDGRTPLQLAKERRYNPIIAIFKKFGNVKISHPIDSYVNVLLMGNPGAGKSTLSHVINDTATGSITFGSFRNVGGVVPCTAGIIPYKLQHKELGNIILHDFAGHSEYYSSHSAVIENLLHGSGGVFVIVVNILEKEAVKQLHQWLTVVRNEAQKALNQCHIIVIVSHMDKISNSVERRRRKEEIQEIIVRERCDSVFLDCRKLGGSGMDSFFKKLSSSCEFVRSTSGKNLSLYCHMMYGLLEERKENILTLSDVMSAGKDNNDYILPDNREDVLDVLYSLHSTGLISVPKREDKVWVVVNKGILLTEVDGILFAPKTFKEHVDIASNTGIVSVCSLTRLFPKYDPDMLICFLKNMELCQEMNPSFLRMTNLHQLAVEEEEEGETERRGERLLFFPCLLSSDRPDEMTSQAYQFGWCLQCTREHHFFLLDTSTSSRYILLLSFRYQKGTRN